VPSPNRATLTISPRFKTRKDRLMIEALHADSFARSGDTSCDSGAAVRTGVPNGDWSLEELYLRAAWEANHIGRSEFCSIRYWNFGKAMLLVQSQVLEGRWKAWCIERKIQPDRWKRGRLLALAFSSPDQVANLTINAATELARELLGLPRRRTAADTKLRRSLTLMNKSLQSSLDDFDGVTSANGLRRRIAELARKLAALDRACIALDERLDSFGGKRSRPKRPK
jgi:hypothetical protein